MPSITPAQIAVVLKYFLAVGLALGLHMSATTRAEIIGSSTAIAIAITAADLFLRRGRQQNLGHLFNSPAVSELVGYIESLQVKPPVAMRIAAEAAAEESVRKSNGPEPPPGTAPTQLAGEPEATGS